ncbi:MAG: Dabb family protein [Eubacterium sp.]|nr:Dabb family protein [Eubacterium sp.]
MVHCILVKFREDVGVDEREDLLPDIRLLFGRLKGIDGIHDVKVIPNVINRPNRYDLLIRIDMDREALEVYDQSEPHMEWKTEYAAYLEKKAIFDYEE